jgi:hypothetical protein
MSALDLVIGKREAESVIWVIMNRKSYEGGAKWKKL